MELSGYGVRLEATVPSTQRQAECSASRNEFGATSPYLRFFLLGAWVSAEAAAVLAAADDLGLLSTLEAAVAAFLPVCSFRFLLAIREGQLSLQMQEIQRMRTSK
jgi:hypothetical protein